MTEPEKAAEAGTGLVAELVPRLTKLSGVLNRGRLVERAMQAAGLPLDRPAISVLVTLHQAEGPLRVGEIAARMQVVGPHVTRQVNELERRGLVLKVPDPHDSRSRLIESTPEGKAATERYVGVILGLFTEVLTEWPEQDRNDLGRLLKRFADDVTTHLATLDTP